MKCLRYSAAVWIVSVLTALCSKTSAGAIVEQQSQIRAQSCTAIKVVAHPTGKLGTAFYIDWDQDTVQGLTVVITAKHLLLEADSVFLQFQLVDDQLRVVDSRTIPTGLYSAGGDSLFVVGPPDTDLAALVARTPRVHRDKPASTVGIPESSLRGVHTLFAGQPVFHYGYELGKALDGVRPLLRSGVIAGVDTVNGLVVIDAQSFPGSSGSPVFLNPTEPLNAGKVFVGVISGYLPYEKRLRSDQTGEIEMVQNENSGLAVIMAADRVWELGRQAMERYLTLAGRP